VIADGFFLDPAPFTVTVTDGIVTLAGDLGSVILGRNIADQVRHSKVWSPSATASLIRCPSRPIKAH